MGGLRPRDGFVSALRVAWWRQDTYLVDCGDDLGFLKQNLKVLNAKVGDSVQGISANHIILRKEPQHTQSIEPCPYPTTFPSPSTSRQT